MSSRTTHPNPQFQVFSLLSPVTHPTLPTSPNTKLHPVRRSHQKSRAGCAACKAKRVKCDEGAPECGRCLRLRRCGEGGQCVYENTTKTGRKRDRVESRRDSGRESSSTGSPEEDGEVEVVERTVARRTSVDSAMSISSITEEWNSMAVAVSPRSLGSIPVDQELLRHYDDMTSEGLLIGPESAHYHTNVLRLAQKYTYLRHTLLSTAALHLSRSTPHNSYHATQHLHLLTSALHDFQEAITLPLVRSASDALIITSFLITIQYLSLPHSSLCPQSSWVYSNSPGRLHWLSVQQGTSALLGKFRPHHCENRMLLHFSPPKPSPRPTSNSSVRALPDSFFTLCNVTDPMGQPGCHQNPYHDPVHALSRLLPLPTGRRSLSKYLHFVSRVYAPFIQLVERNDHRALLILGYWFALICGVGEEVWWCWGRARRDCWAICEVLNREAGEEVRKLVGFMEGACGFEREKGEETRVVQSRDCARSENEFQGVDCD